MADDSSSESETDSSDETDQPRSSSTARHKGDANSEPKAGYNERRHGGSLTQRDGGAGLIGELLDSQRPAIKTKEIRQEGRFCVEGGEEEKELLLERRTVALAVLEAGQLIGDVEACQSKAVTGGISKGSHIVDVQLPSLQPKSQHHHQQQQLFPRDSSSLPRADHFHPLLTSGHTSASSSSSFSSSSMPFSSSVLSSSSLSTSSPLFRDVTISSSSSHSVYQSSAIALEYCICLAIHRDSLIRLPSDVLQDILRRTVLKQQWRKEQSENMRKAAQFRENMFRTLDWRRKRAIESIVPIHEEASRLRRINSSVSLLPHNSLTQTQSEVSIAERPSTLPTSLPSVPAHQLFPSLTISPSTTALTSRASSLMPTRRPLEESSTLTSTMTGATLTGSSLVTTSGEQVLDKGVNLLMRLLPTLDPARGKTDTLELSSNLHRQHHKKVPSSLPALKHSQTAALMTLVQQSTVADALLAAAPSDLLGESMNQVASQHVSSSIESPTKTLSHAPQRQPLFSPPETLLPPLPHSLASSRPGALSSRHSGSGAHQSDASTSTSMSTSTLRQSHRRKRGYMATGRYAAPTTSLHKQSSFMAATPTMGSVVPSSSLQNVREHATSSSGHGTGKQGLVNRAMALALSEASTKSTSQGFMATFGATSKPVLPENKNNPNRTDHPSLSAANRALPGVSLGFGGAAWMMDDSLKDKSQMPPEGLSEQIQIETARDGEPQATTLTSNTGQGLKMRDWQLSKRWVGFGLPKRVKRQNSDKIESAPPGASATLLSGANEEWMWSDQLSAWRRRSALMGKGPGTLYTMNNGDQTTNPDQPISMSSPLSSPLSTMQSTPYGRPSLPLDRVVVADSEIERVLSTQIVKSVRDNGVEALQGLVMAIQGKWGDESPVDTSTTRASATHKTVTTHSNDYSSATLASAATYAARKAMARPTKPEDLLLAEKEATGVVLDGLRDMEESSFDNQVELAKGEFLVHRAAGTAVVESIALARKLKLMGGATHPSHTSSAPSRPLPRADDVHSCDATASPHDSANSHDNRGDGNTEGSGGDVGDDWAMRSVKGAFSKMLRDSLLHFNVMSFATSPTTTQRRQPPYHLLRSQQGLSSTDNDPDQSTQTHPHPNAVHNDTATSEIGAGRVPLHSTRRTVDSVLRGSRPPPLLALSGDRSLSSHCKPTQRKVSTHGSFAQREPTASGHALPSGGGTMTDKTFYTPTVPHLPFARSEKMREFWATAYARNKLGEATEMKESASSVSDEGKQGISSSGGATIASSPSSPRHSVSDDLLPLPTTSTGEPQGIVSVDSVLPSHLLYQLDATQRPPSVSGQLMSRVAQSQERETALQSRQRQSFARAPGTVEQGVPAWIESREDTLKVLKQSAANTKRLVDQAASVSQYSFTGNVQRQSVSH